MKKILLVEDESIIALVTSRRLGTYGYGVESVHSGGGAVDAVNQAAEKGLPFDLILMDIDLGSGMDETEAARIILGRHDVPVVFLTSHAEREMVEKVKSITRYGYVLKQSGEFVLRSSIEMAFELFDSNSRIKFERSYFEHLFQSIPEPIAILDKNDRIMQRLRFNPCSQPGGAA